MNRTYDWQGFNWLAWAGVLLAAAAFVFLILTGRWQGLLTVVGFTAVAVAFLVMADRVPALVNLLVIITALINAAAYIWNLYQQWWWTDRVVHGFSIFTVTVVLGVLLVGLVFSNFRDHRLLFILSVASLGITVGALWEVLEWTYDVYIAQNVIKGKWDTMLDLVVDSIAALLGGWLTWLIIRKNRPSSYESR